MEVINSHDVGSFLTDQENGSITDYLRLFIILFILVIFLFFIKRKKRDLKKQQIKQSNSIPNSKIIVALQIDNFFVHISNRLQFGYQPLIIQKQQSHIIWKTLQKVLGYQLCFKPLYSSRQITNFVRGLKNTPRIQLMLYTSLSPQVTDAILKKLRLADYFKPQNRKFSDPKQHDMMKHAIDVDKQSRRVVIITPNKKDHSWEDEKYFLVQNPKGGRYKSLLKDCLRNIKELVQRNDSMDTLHDELAQLKIDVQESDMSQMSDAQKQLS